MIQGFEYGFKTPPLNVYFLYYTGRELDGFIHFVEYVMHLVTKDVRTIEDNIAKDQLANPHSLI